MKRVYVPKVRIKMLKEEEFSYPINEKADSIANAARISKDMITEYDREILGVFCLDAKMHILNVCIVSIGTVDAVFATPRDIFKTAILSNSKYILVFHSHPSGDITPSEEDITITDKLIKAGRLMEIELLDHIIVNPFDYSYYSFHDNQRMEAEEIKFCTKVNDINW